MRVLDVERDMIAHSFWKNFPNFMMLKNPAFFDKIFCQGLANIKVIKKLKVFKVTGECYWKNVFVQSRVYPICV